MSHGGFCGGLLQEYDDYVSQLAKESLGFPKMSCGCHKGEGHQGFPLDLIPDNHKVMNGWMEMLHFSSSLISCLNYIGLA